MAASIPPSHGNNQEQLNNLQLQPDNDGLRVVGARKCDSCLRSSSSLFAPALNFVILPCLHNFCSDCYLPGNARAKCLLCTPSIKGNIMDDVLTAAGQASFMLGGSGGHQGSGGISSGMLNVSTSSSLFSASLNQGGTIQSTTIAGNNTHHNLDSSLFPQVSPSAMYGNSSSVQNRNISSSTTPLSSTVSNHPIAGGGSVYDPMRDSPMNFSNLLNLVGKSASSVADFNFQSSGSYATNESLAMPASAGSHANNNQLFGSRNEYMAFSTNNMHSSSSATSNIQQPSSNTTTGFNYSTQDYSPYNFNSRIPPPSAAAAAPAPGFSAVVGQNISYHSQSSQRNLCTCCNEGAPAIAKCQECQEVLCQNCVHAHQRVRMTKDHHISSFSSTNSSSTSHSPASVSLATVTHSTQQMTLDSNSLFSQQLSNVTPHVTAPAPGVTSRNSVVSVVREVRSLGRGFEEGVEAVDRMGERVDAQLTAIANQVKSVMHHHVSTLEERRRDLLSRVDVIRAVKLNALKSQREQLIVNASRTKELLGKLENTINSNMADKEGGLSNNTIQQIQHLMNLRALVIPQEDDHVKFDGPSIELAAQLGQLGKLQMYAYAPNSVMIGNSYKRAIKDRRTQLLLQARNHLNEPCGIGGDRVEAMVRMRNGQLLYAAQVEDKQNGTYVINYTPQTEGDLEISMTIRGAPIHGSPFQISVRRGRDYTTIGHRPLFTFSSEGADDGQISRPWGICCDKLNRLIVGDRSNNRISIFSTDGDFLKRFGSRGIRNGQFDRPAGVCVNSENHIIVADKDNHRIQVFDSEGIFLIKFGEKGRLEGQFSYPWDVAANVDDQIAVSDTRNHRVQLFSKQGQYITKFGYENTLYQKSFDSPRGVVFAPGGHLLVTDFNNHRLVVIQIDSNDNTHHRFHHIGKEGEMNGYFRRPQGIDVDLEGYILFGLEVVATSRTTSIMDRPADVAVAPDGRVFVLDFGNNQIHCF